jgi:hypothetical protein
MKGNILNLLLGVIVLSSDTTPLKAQEVEWRLVFSDEFNQPNGSQPDPAKWNRAMRNPSIWARWNSNSDKVVFIKTGYMTQYKKVSPDIRQVRNSMLKILWYTVWKRVG